MEFKDRIRQLRDEKGITPSKLAADFEKSESAIRMWEAGRTKPDADTLIKLANYFDCSTDYLLGLSDIRGEAQAEQIHFANARLAEALKAYEGHETPHSKRPYADLLVDMLKTHWFSGVLRNLDAYVNFEEDKANKFRTFKGVAYKYGGSSISEIPVDQLLDHFLFSAQHQMGNTCRQLREDRLKAHEGDQDGEA